MIFVDNVYKINKRTNNNISKSTTMLILDESFLQIANFFNCSLRQDFSTLLSFLKNKYSDLFEYSKAGFD